MAEPTLPGLGSLYDALAYELKYALQSLDEHEAKHPESTDNILHISVTGALQCVPGGVTLDAVYLKIRHRRDTGRESWEVTLAPDSRLGLGDATADEIEHGIRALLPPDVAYLVKDIDLNALPS